MDDTMKMSEYQKLVLNVMYAHDDMAEVVQKVHHQVPPDKEYTVHDRDGTIVDCKDMDWRLTHSDTNDVCTMDMHERAVDDTEDEESQISPRWSRGYSEMS